MKNCPNCAQENDEQALFCKACGYAFPSHEEAAAVEPQASAGEDVPAPEVPPAFEPPMVSPASVYYDEEPAAPRKGMTKKKLWVIIASCVLGLAVIGGLLFYFLVWNSPKAKVMRAFSKTNNAFYANFENAETLNAMGDAFAKMEDQYQLQFNMDVYSYYDEVDASFSLSQNYDRKAKLLNGTFAISGAVEEQYLDLALNYSADEEQLLLQLPGALQDIYSVPTIDFGKELVNAAFFDPTFPEASIFEEISIDFFRSVKSWEDFKKAYGDEVDAFMDSIEIVESGTRNLYGYSDFSCTDYRIHFSSQKLAEVLEKFYEFQFDTSLPNLTNTLMPTLSTLNDFEVSIDSNGYVRRIEVFYDAGNDMESASLSLLGEGNPWSRTALTVTSDGDEETLYGGISPNEDGFEITLLEISGNSVTVVCDDDLQEFTLYAVSGLQSVPIMTMQYDLGSDGSCSFNLPLEVLGEASVNFDFSMKPLTQTPSMLSGNIVPLFALTQDDFMEIAEQIAAYYN
ncbi:MAG: hypothetical protein LBM28_06930 [Oscillospiraceae bacterium]|jgi:hypothetical protein|nr:hypothetical protein [Oscillospiraceae bacterium]